MSKTQGPIPSVTIETAPEVGTQPERRRRSLFRRLLDAVIESKMRRAEREVRRHIKLVPDDVLRRAGHQVSLVDGRRHISIRPFVERRMP